jgi:heme/copper-type cytochrome/quinol oxidase subunit 3
MSATHVDVPAHIGPPIAPERWKTIVHEIDDHRGTYGMLLFILTEAFLFIMLFTAYFYLAQGTWRWLNEKPPKLHYVIPMLIILLASSGVAYWGENQVKRLRYGAGRIALLITILMGVVFLALSALDYKEHLQDVTPQTDAYGSIFYTITTFHVAHLCLGLFMLIFALILPKLEPRRWPPYRPYHNATMYWHFVDLVWVFIVAFLYVGPNVR